MGINKAILVGNVGKDPEVNYVKEDLPVARFTLATSETYRDKKTSEKKTITEWHNIVAWRGLAKLAEQYIRKGTQLYVEGKISSRSYEKDGVTRYFTDITANTIQMLSRLQQNENQKETVESNPNTNQKETVESNPNTNQKETVEPNPNTNQKETVEPNPYASQNTKEENNSVAFDSNDEQDDLPF